MNEYKWNARDILYTPAFLAGVASFILFSVEEEENDLRFRLLYSAPINPPFLQEPF